MSEVPLYISTSVAVAEATAVPVHPTPYALHTTHYTLHPTHYTLHAAPYTLRTAHYTLHPTPYTLHPTPNTQHSIPYTPHPTWPSPRRARRARFALPRKALRGGIAKVKFQELALNFGDKCPQNGSKNAPMAPRPHLGCPHEGSRVEPQA